MRRNGGGVEMLGEEVWSREGGGSLRGSGFGGVVFIR